MLPRRRHRLTAVMLALLGLPGTGLAATPKPRVLVMPFRAEGYSPGEVRLLEQRVAERLTPHAEVLTAQDLNSMLELETQRQLATCTDDSCLAALTDSLGARFIVTGTLGQLGVRQIGTLALIDVTTARTIERASAEGTGSTELAARMDGAAEVMVRALRREAGIREPGPLLVVGAVVAGLGTVAAVGTGAAALWANSVVNDTAEPPAKRQQLQTTGQLLLVATVGGALVALGGGIVVGLDLLLGVGRDL